MGFDLNSKDVRGRLPALYEHVVAHKDELLADLERFVNIDSGSGYGPGLKKFQGLLIDRLKELGAEVTVLEVDAPQAGYNIVATFRGTGKGTALLLAHADTVWPAGTAMERPFHQDDKRAYGPGVCDDKGGIVLVLHALALLQEMNFKDYDRITFMINPDEEKSSLKSKDLIMELAKEHQYVLCSEAGKVGDGITLWHKGSGRLTIEVFGRNAHAGTEPEKGRNAVVELAHQMLQMSKLSNSELETAINFTGIDKTKNAHNVIPDYAWGQASVRVLYPEEFDRIEQQAAILGQNNLVPDTVVKIDLFRGRPPLPKNPQSEAVAQHLVDIYANELGMKLSVGGSGGASDANLVSGITTVIDGVGIVGGKAHTPDEFIELDSIVPRLYLMTRALMDIGSGKL